MARQSTVELNEGEEARRVRFRIPQPNAGKQSDFVRSLMQRKAAKCGRRSGKTFAEDIIATCYEQGICNACLGAGCVRCDFTGRRPRVPVLYAAPTTDQVDAFWHVLTQIYQPLTDAKIYHIDKNEHKISQPNTDFYIHAKTAWNANMLRGKGVGLLILDEYQMQNERVWKDVGEPMLLDWNGDAIFSFTPPSLSDEGINKAQDPRHASKLFKDAQEDKSGLWETFHFTPFDNPTLPKEALDNLVNEMRSKSLDSYNREILAIDDEIEKSWLVYSRFDSATQVIKRFPIPSDWLVDTGHDFGEANPAALFVAQVREPKPPGAPAYLRIGDYVAFSEYAPGAGTSAQQHVDKFWDVMGVMPNGERKKPARSTGGNVTTEQQTRELYGRLGWRIEAPPITRVNLQVDRAISLMEKRQIYVFEDLHQFIYEILNCMWEIDNEKRTTNKIKDEARYHLLACWRYLATVLAVARTSEKVIYHVRQF